MRSAHILAASLIVGVLTLVGAGCSNDSSNPYGATSTSPGSTLGSASPNTVLMSGMVFSPVTITVAVGTTITWRNNDGIAHTSTSDTGVWNTGKLEPGTSATTTFTTAGTFPYNCIYHASMGMKGTVIVQ